MRCHFLARAFAWYLTVAISLPVYTDHPVACSRLGGRILFEVSRNCISLTASRHCSTTVSWFLLLGRLRCPKYCRARFGQTQFAGIQLVATPQLGHSWCILHSSILYVRSRFARWRVHQVCEVKDAFCDSSWFAAGRTTWLCSWCFVSATCDLFVRLVTVRRTVSSTIHE